MTTLTRKFCYGKEEEEPPACTQRKVQLWAQEGGGGGWWHCRFPIRVQKERFLLFLTSDTVTTIYSNMKKNAAKNSRLETESHLICAPSTQSDDRRQVHPRRWSWGGKTRSWQPFRVRPLYDDILSACRAYYNQTRELAKTGTTQCIKDPLTADRVKCFILTESRIGYSIRVSIWALFSHPAWALDSMFTWTLFIPVLNSSWTRPASSLEHVVPTWGGTPQREDRCSHQNMWMNICQVVSFVTGTGDPSTVTDTDAGHQSNVVNKMI